MVWAVTKISGPCPELADSKACPRRSVQGRREQLSRVNRDRPFFSPIAGQGCHRPGKDALVAPRRSTVSNGYGASDRTRQVHRATLNRHNKPLRQ